MIKTNKIVSTHKINVFGYERTIVCQTKSELEYMFFDDSSGRAARISKYNRPRCHFLSAEISFTASCPFGSKNTCSPLHFCTICDI